MGGHSYGPAVGEWAQRLLGVELFPWQQYVLNGMLEHDQLNGDGYGLRHRLGLVSCARQQGKTVALTALIGWWLTDLAQLRGEPQTVLSTALDLKLATTIFQRLAPLLERAYGAKVIWSYGRNEVHLTDGSIWKVVAASPTCGHGYSPDLVVADELWSIGEDAVDQGLVPSQRARRSSLFSAWSTAGTEQSRVMLRMREEGIRSIDLGKPGRLYMAEYSIPNGDPLDERLWCYANPSLGRTIDIERLREESQAPDRTAFLRGSLNLWVASDRGWLPPGVWDELEQPTPADAAGGVLSVEQSQTDARYGAVRAVATADKRVHVWVPFTAESQTQLWQHIEAAMAADPRLSLTVPPSLEVVVPPGLARRCTTVGYRELVKHTALVQSLILEGRVRHDGGTQLADHVNRAVAARTNGGLVLTSQRSPGPIELARCMVWAVAGAARPSWSQRPAMGSSR